METTYHIFRDCIAIHSEGKTFLISNTDKRYADIILLIRDNKLDEIGRIANKEAQLEIKKLIGL